MKKRTEAPHNPKAQGTSSSKRAPGRKRTTAPVEEIPAGEGVKRLRDSVDQELGKRSKGIAKKLVDKTIDGNMTSARLLVGISGADKLPPPKPKKKGLSEWVRRLCSEPEWNGPWEDEDGKRDASQLPPSEPEEGEWEKHPGENWIDGRWVRLPSP